MYRIVLASLVTLISTMSFATPVTYDLDPRHTYPSFAADHMCGLSIWRGKVTDTSGRVVFDKDSKSGSVEVTVNMNSADFGLAKLDEHAKSPEIFDASKFPTATYSGTFTQWSGSTPTEVQGTLTLHGVTKPLTLKINSFMCKPNPTTKKEICGADASAQFNRSDFGITWQRRGLGSLCHDSGRTRNRESIGLGSMRRR